MPRTSNIRRREPAPKGRGRACAFGAPDSARLTFHDAMRCGPSLALAAALLAASALPAQGVRSRARVPGVPAPGVPDVRLVGPPTAWVVPFTEGNTAEGKLYFGATVENTSARIAWVGLSFSSYLPDGTRFDGCYAMARSGPGASAEVPPRGRAFVTCHRSIVPLDRAAGLQVTSRLWDVRAVVPGPVAATVVAADLVPGDSTGGDRRYDAFASVRARSGADVSTYVFFRLLAADGTQVATCESDAVTIEPEVAVRVTCGGGGVFVPDGSPRPTAVHAELRSAGS